MVICHAGAGTLLDCIKDNKKTFAIVNNDLVENHQVELFDKLLKQNLISGVRDFKDLSPKTFDEILCQLEKQVI